MLEFAMAAGRILLGAAGIVSALLAVGFVWESLSARAARKRFPAPGRMVDVGGGRMMHILCKGEAPGPTVVMEMGAGQSSPNWWGIQDAVASFARVCTYDRAGLGWSDPPDRRITLDSRAADLHAVLTAANIPGPYLLVGHSLGGPILRLYARAALSKVAGFVFVDTPDEAAMFRDSYLKFVRKRMKPMMAAIAIATRIGLMRSLAALWPDNPFAPHVSGEARRALDATRGAKMFDAAAGEFEALLQAPEELRREFGLGGRLGGAPVSVITHGMKFPPPYDVLEIGWDEGQQRLAALSTDSELIVASKSNHAIQSDEPELVIDAIRRVHAAARDGARLQWRTVE